jgi:hypothetical protein
VIGQYLAKIYMETKERLRHIIEKVLGGCASSVRPGLPASQPAVDRPESSSRLLKERGPGLAGRDRVKGVLCVTVS